MLLPHQQTNTPIFCNELTSPSLWQWRRARHSAAPRPWPKSFRVFAEGAGNGLLRQVFVQKFAGISFGLQMVGVPSCGSPPGGCASISLAGSTPRGQRSTQAKQDKALVNDLARPSAARYSPFSTMSHKLVRMIFHLVIGRAGAGALAAFHALARIDAARCAGPARCSSFCDSRPCSIRLLHAQRFRQQLGEVVRPAMPVLARFCSGCTGRAGTR